MIELGLKVASNLRHVLLVVTDVHDGVSIDLDLVVIKLLLVLKLCNEGFEDALLTFPFQVFPFVSSRTRSSSTRCRTRENDLENVFVCAIYSTQL